MEEPVPYDVSAGPHGRPIAVEGSGKSFSLGTAESPLIERMADALEDAKDTIVELSRAADNEYAAVGFGVRINKLLDEYQAWRRANSNQR